jgi:hypothetical protein
MEECDACGKRVSNEIRDRSEPATKLMRCSRCRGAVYCNRECQIVVRNGVIIIHGLAPTIYVSPDWLNA